MWARIAQRAMVHSTASMKNTHTVPWWFKMTVSVWFSDESIGHNGTDTGSARVEDRIGSDGT